MRFPAKDQLSEEEIQRGLKSVLRDGIASQSMVTLTGGVFLVAFALKLGASNSIIGFLAAIPPLMQLLQIPAIFLVEKVKNRRAISVYTSLISRIFWLFVAFIPFLFSKELGLLFLIIALFLQSGFGAISSCSWGSWMRDLIPKDQLGAFYSRRMRFSIGFGIILSLLAGVFIDWGEKTFPAQEIYTFAFLFFLGFIAGMIGIRFMSTIPEPRLMIEGERPNFWQTILKPFKDISYQKLLWFLGSWSFAVNIAAPFFTVYMLKRLQMDMSFIVLLMILSQTMNVAFLRTWGRFTDHFSNKSVFAICGPLFIACILAWTFTTLPEKHTGTIPLLIIIHIFMGISTAGVTLASGNFGLKLSPKGYATSYLAATSVVNSLCAGVAPILGGQFADFFTNRELSLTLAWKSPVREMAIQTVNFQHWDFFFFSAFLIGLYSIYRLTKIKEAGEVEERVVIGELISEVRREMRNLSTIGGLRQMVQFPFTLVRSTMNSL
jgi:MFS family permease